MKRILLALTSIICLSASAQIKMPAASPTQTLSQEFGMGKIDINYSRPGIKGRSVFGDGSLLAPNGVVWRTGANEATTIEISNDITFTPEMIVIPLPLKDKDTSSFSYWLQKQ